MGTDEYALFDIEEVNEELEKEEEKELEEFLYSRVHYASQLEIEIQKLENNKTNFPEATPLQAAILGAENDENKKNKKNQVAVVSEDTDQWDIDDTDLGKSKQYSATNRYYISEGENLPNIYCYNCDERGHIGKNCTKEKRKPTCHLCGTLGHNRQTCPNELCYNCLNPGHVAKYCKEEKKKPWLLKCERCNFKGHKKSECTEIWRQYHCTVKNGEIVKPKNPKEKNEHRFCYNCASRKHFGEHCSEKRFAHRWAYSQFIVNYDKCAVSEKKRKEPQKPQKPRDEELKKSSEKKSAKKKPKETTTLKEKGSKISKGKDPKEISKLKKSAKTKNVKTSGESKTTKEAQSKTSKEEIEIKKTADSKTSKKVQDTTESSKSKKKVELSKDKTKDDESKSKKKKKDERKENKKVLTKRAKGILRNLWVSDEDLIDDDIGDTTASDKTKNEKEAFSVMDDLGISPERHQRKDNVQKTNNKTKSLKRKIQNILPKIDKTDKISSVEQSKAKKAKLTNFENDKISTATTTREEPRKRPVKENLNKDLNKGNHTQQLNVEASSSKADLDHETLKDLQEILIDSDDDDDDDVTFQTPCPVPDVNVICLSSDVDDDDAVDMVANNTSEDHEHIENDSVFLNSINHDDSHYDPCKVYEQDLAAYELVSSRTVGSTSHNKKFDHGSTKTNKYTQKQIKELLTKAQKRHIRRAVDKEQLRLGIDKSLPFEQQRSQRSKVKHAVEKFRKEETQRVLKRALQEKGTQNKSKKQKQEKLKEKQQKLKEKQQKQNTRDGGFWKNVSNTERRWPRPWK